MKPYLQMANIMLSMINGDLNKNSLIMMLSVNYEFKSFGVRWVMIFRKVGFSHEFWAVFSFPLFSSGVVFSCRVFWGFQRMKTSKFSVETMGGKRKRVEPPSFPEWKNKSQVWDILRCGNFIRYMERLRGNNLTITHQFIKSWKDGSVMVGNQHMDVTEDVITEATRLDMDGINFYQERKLLDRAIDDFVQIEKQKNCLVKIGNSYYNPTSIS